MFELVQVSPQCYYIESPAKVGVYKQNETDVYLIDGGSDKNAAKRVMRVVNANNWRVLGIINTHAHADHNGGNRYIQEQTGCKIFSDSMESAITCNTLLQPTLLYGAYPPKELMHKFTYAQPSKAVGVDDADFPKELEVVDISGHSGGMIGIIAPDGTAFVGDIISSENILEKYKITYLYNVEKYLESLETVKNINAKIFVPSHDVVTTDIAPIADYNRKKVLEIGDSIVDILSTQPMCFETLLQKLFYRFELKMNFEQYCLVGSTVRSYISWLKGDGRVDFEIVDNCVLWHKVQAE